MNKISVQAFDTILAAKAGRHSTLTALVGALRGIVSQLPGVIEEPYQVKKGWGTKFKYGSSLLLAADPRPDAGHVCVKIPGASDNVLGRAGAVHPRKGADSWVDVASAEDVRLLESAILERFMGLSGSRVPEFAGASWNQEQLEGAIVDYFDQIERGESNGDRKPASQVPDGVVDGRSSAEGTALRCGISHALNQAGLPFLGEFPPNKQRVPGLEGALQAYLAGPFVHAGHRREVDYAALAAANQELGRQGEEWVFRFEQERLRLDLDKADLAVRVEWVAKTRGDGLGYDILSFNADGSERLIEVKTTTLAGAVPFLVTANELEVSRRESGRYFLYRLSNFRVDPKLTITQGAVDEAHAIEPTAYRARPRPR